MEGWLGEKGRKRREMKEPYMTKDYFQASKSEENVQRSLLG